MLSEETNIYVPIYTVKEDISLLKSTNDESWCEEQIKSIKSITSNDLEKLSNDFKVALLFIFFFN